eukprot:TRINITY_DN3763_c0_g1_i1.p1 TRINITY_DN3763_c0_g1~~TRINITY_DN3763_c0_g1_i1.p1  ORF type:complete len:230 (-),score=-7.14 TRINITY_DN3763_c0_g1_i1:267-956(-)
MLSNPDADSSASIVDEEDQESRTLITTLVFYLVCSASASFALAQTRLVLLCFRLVCSRSNSFGLLCSRLNALLCSRSNAQRPLNVCSNALRPLNVCSNALLSPAKLRYSACLHIAIALRFRRPFKSFSNPNADSSAPIVDEEGQESRTFGARVPPLLLCFRLVCSRSNLFALLCSRLNALCPLNVRSNALLSPAKLHYSARLHVAIVLRFRHPLFEPTVQAFRLGGRRH